MFTDNFEAPLGIQLPELPDSKDFINVDMNSFGVTKATLSNPIIKSIGMGGCVYLGLYDGDNKIAGVSHISVPLERVYDFTKIDKSVDAEIIAVLQAMKKNSSNIDRSNLEIGVVGGRIDKGGMDILYFPLHSIVLSRLHQLGFPTPKIIISDTNMRGFSVALDSRNGVMYRLKNILSLNYTQYDIITMQRGSLKPRVTSDPRSLK